MNDISQNQRKMPHKDLNLIPEVFSVSRVQKEQLNGHRSFVLWFTGLSASGKSTIARHLEEKLHSQGIRTIILDGDNTRIGINKDLDLRDPKGLYQKALDGEIADFTGVSSLYEPPLKPDIHLRTDQLSVANAVENVFSWLVSNNFVRDNGNRLTSAKEPRSLI